MKTLESLNTKVVTNLLSFLPATHMASSNTWFDGYEFSKWTVVLNGSGQIGDWSKTSGLGYKMDEDQQSLNTVFAANSLSFSMLTHTHGSDNHSDVYGHPKTAIVQHFRGTARKGFRLNGLETWNDSGLRWRLQLLNLIS
jgi:hypothetical protein